MESKNKGKLNRVRKYEFNKICTFLDFEDFTELKRINKKFAEHYTKNYKKLIIFNYIKKSNIYTSFLENDFLKFLKNFSLNFFKNNDKNFKEFLIDTIKGNYIHFACYKNEGDYFNKDINYHHQNLFNLSDKWFCSIKRDSPFNLYATPSHLSLDKKIFIIDKDNFLYSKNKKHLTLDSITNLIKNNFVYNFQDIFHGFLTEKLYDDFDKYDSIFEFYQENISMEPESLRSKSFLEFINYEHHKKKLFILQNFLASNLGGGYTCPVRSFAVYIMDDFNLNEEDTRLLDLNFDSAESLREKIQEENKIFATKFNHQLNGISEKFTIIQDNTSKEKSRIIEFDTMKQRYYKFNLKLMIWVELALSTTKIFNLTKLMHFGKQIIVKAIKQHKMNTYDSNVDFKSLNFFGSYLEMNA